MPTAKRIIVAFRIPEALRDVLSGVTDYAKQAGLRWQVRCVDPDELEPALSKHRADGAITVVTPSATGMIRRLRGYRIPIVNTIHDLAPQIPSVLSDDRAIGAVAAQYLAQRGFRAMAFAGVNTAWSSNRLQGFIGQLAQAGLSPSRVINSLAIPDFHLAGRNQAVGKLRKWLRELPRPIAILAASDFIAEALLTACEAEGIAVPNSAAIIGIDNFHTICELAPVPLSSVAQDFVRIGSEAAQLLAGLMSNPRRANVDRILVPPGQVHIRQSTDIFAFEDQRIAAAMRLIHENAPVGISMKKLLREVPMSRKGLDERFKAVVGHTPSQEIRRCRMDYVRNLLLETNMSLEQIALRCEFSCVANLIRCFRGTHGSPPHAYRLTHRTREASA